MSKQPLSQTSEDEIINPKLNVSCLDFLLIELVPLAQRITEQLHAPGTIHMDDETREAVFWRLDGLGYRVGQGLVERFSANKPRPTTPLDAIKFICKDLWILLFRKQIDNLKTNHRGVYVLTDVRFQPLSRMSVDRRAGPKAGEDALRRAQAFLYFPCGVVRGALQGLGLDVTVTAETTEIPSATFQIKTKGAKA
ncbi:uncharacterized protein MYCFIDRAFT_188929 [Pseudocercospora fijiensis CIRAD86]|uniref:Transport protein particle component n=1 Tax=Pseudocercospora fijiensis (strain CIRAD86) TaxID=383855 RepID=M2ZT07_PSEFD|nr:uncharacterized protein MYCFIDRAFT_188929 [Pseudocercospora fijiensis CIRAD86]EME82149.1 hypothetical protein MYCFIDRAFT_188929 [Pseudocercospora fijiensis CIRAD86]